MTSVFRSINSVGHSLASDQECCEETGLVAPINLRFWELHTNISISPSISRFNIIVRSQEPDVQEFDPWNQPILYALRIAASYWIHPYVVQRTNIPLYQNNYQILERSRISILMMTMMIYHTQTLAE